MVPDGFAGDDFKECGVCSGCRKAPNFNSKSHAIPKHKRRAVKDDSTITAIMLLLSPPFFLLGTSTPNGFNVCPLLSRPPYGPLSIVAMLEGAEGGEGGRPVKS